MVTKQKCYWFHDCQDEISPNSCITHKSTQLDPWGERIKQTQCTRGNIINTRLCFNLLVRALLIKNAECSVWRFSIQRLERKGIVLENVLVAVLHASSIQKGFPSINQAMRYLYCAFPAFRYDTMCLTWRDVVFNHGEVEREAGVRRTRWRGGGDLCSDVQTQRR
jgi:hypothetical protein